MDCTCCVIVLFLLLYFLLKDLEQHVSLHNPSLSWDLMHYSNSLGISGGQG